MSKNEATVVANEATSNAKVSKIEAAGIDRSKLYEEHKTVSGCIRALHAQGYTRGEIAVFLGKRYQHVRNVLVQDAIAAQSKK